MSVSPLHLLHHAWLPVRRRSGVSEFIRPCEVVAGPDDPVVELAWPRADFRAAAHEFLIGLLSTAAPPARDADWRAWWRSPPASEELARLFAPFEAAFVFDGPGPRFLQDAGDLGAAIEGVSGLFIEQPGANTEKNNTDLFQKRGRIGVVGRSTAAMALYTLQAWAPSGGAGHRTGLRGGGPMTTLALPPDPSEATLWRVLWLNVVRPWTAADPAPVEDLARVFPWLAPTRVSDGNGVATTLLDAHPAQAFWGMPRRLRLQVEPNVENAACDVTGRVEDAVVRFYAARPWGVNYSGVPHPLSPTYRVKANAEWLPAHPQPGALAWRYWPGFTLGADEKSGRASRRARCIDEAARRLRGLGAAEARVWIVGADMDNAKARGFLDAQRPFFQAGEDEDGRFAALVAMLVESATEAASLLSGAIRDAHRSDKGASIDLAVETFWTATEDAFWDALRTRAPDDEALPAFLRDEWLARALRRPALAIFDREAPAAGVAVSGDVKALERLAGARQRLTLAFAGHGAAGKRLFASVLLAPPTSEKKPVRKANRRSAS